MDWGLDAIAELPEIPDHLGRSALCARPAYLGAAFNVADALAEDLPDQSTQPMRDGPDRLRMPKSRNEPPVHELEDTPLGLDRRVGRRYMEEAAHLPVATRAAVTRVHARTLFRPGTRPRPGRELLGRGKRPGRRRACLLWVFAPSRPGPSSEHSRSTLADLGGDGVGTEGGAGAEGHGLLALTIFLRDQRP